MGADRAAHGDDDALPGHRYTFGDTDAAAVRLRLLADLLAESTAAFLRSAAPPRPRLAVDLGCGPGHSTRLLASVVGAERTVGLDTSTQFLDRAHGPADADADERVGFVQHDVTAVPFPVGGPADLLYARFLLMHLPDPDEVLARWAGALAPGGVVLVQESETIRTAHPAFDHYLDIVAAVLADNDNEIYLGHQLAGHPEPAPLVRRSSQVWTVAAPADVAARLYSLNLRSMRHQDYVRRNVDPAALDQLDADLTELATTSDRPGIEWDVRGLVYQR